MNPYATTYRGIDLIAVERVLTNSRPMPQLTEKEWEYTARILLATPGIGTKEAAARLGVTQRTLLRWQAKWRANGKAKSQALAA